MSGIYVNPNTKFVGIGTIAPTSRLQVDGNARFGSNADTDAHTIIGSASVTCSNAAGAAALIVNQQGTGKIFELQNSGTARITVLDGGNVGIGIANPTQKLYVVGDTRIEGNLTVNGTQTVINTDVITTEQLLVTNNGTGPALVVNQTGEQPVIDIQDDGVSVMKIVNNGNIGMGTTDPLQRLHVQGSILATTQHLGPAADTSNAPGFSWSGDSNTGIYRPAADAVGVVTGGVERMRVLANGNVGIGTTNPLGKLEVNIAPVLVGGDPTYKGDIRLISQGGGSILNGTGGIEFKLSNSGPGYGWRINAPDATGASEGTPLSIQSRMGSATWTNNLIIKGDGNVGVGTTNPQAKLHVQGQLHLPLQAGFFIYYYNGVTFNNLPGGGIMPGGIMFKDGVVDHNLNSNFNATTGIFTVPFAGRYKVFASLLVSAGTGRLEFNINVDRSANSLSIVQFGINGTGTTYDNATCSFVMSCQPNDTIYALKLSGTAAPFLRNDNFLGVYYMG